MKLNETAILNYDFNVVKVKLGKINSGAVFLYCRKLWIVLNPMEGGGKLVRTLEGPMHTAKIMPSKTNVYYLESGKSKGMVTNESR